MEANSRLGQFTSHVVHSFSIKLFVLAVILLTVPLILYWQFQRAAREQSVLLHNAVEQSGRLIAAMMRPHFEQFSHEFPAALGDALAGAAIVNTNVKVLVRLAGAKPDEFIYIASSPPLSASYLKQEKHDLVHSGIFQRLAPTCDRTTNLEVRFVNPAGRQELLTSMTPVHVGANCWIVITSENAADLAPTPINVSFWKIPAMPAAAAIYLCSAMLVLLLFAHLWRNVSRFRAAARRIRMRGAGAASFRELNTIPGIDRRRGGFRRPGRGTDGIAGVHQADRRGELPRAEGAARGHRPIDGAAQARHACRRQRRPAQHPAHRALDRAPRRGGFLVRDLEQAAAEVVYPVRGPSTSRVRDPDAEGLRRDARRPGQTPEGLRRTGSDGLRQRGPARTRDREHPGERGELHAEIRHHRSGARTQAAMPCASASPTADRESNPKIAAASSIATSPIATRTKWTAPRRPNTIRAWGCGS